MTQKNKNILLLLGFILLGYLAYQLAISETLFLKNEIEKIESQNLNSENLAKLSSSLSLREQFVDSVLQKKNINNSSIQNSLLEFLNTESAVSEIEISNFNEPHIILQDDVQIISYEFTLKGSYKDIEKLIYLLEQDYSFGQTFNVHFQKKRDYRINNNYLECTVILVSFQ